MSIRPQAANDLGVCPCLPTGSLLAVCERIAQGRAPTLRERVVAALTQLRRKIAR
jgi:hypothetical protein